VAIKSLPPEVKDNPKALSRFTREARVLASLNHPNIATIYDELEEAEGLIYLVLEYVPGQTLAERIAKKPLKLEEALTIALQIAEAVAAAHEHDVIHRDLKPGNIKITQEGKVKVLDFGLAKVVGGESTDQKTTITEPGRVIGTPAYMSPEQARGKPTDKRSDIWSFGCILYEMLTATVPFKGETISDTLANILQTDPEWNALPATMPPNVLVLLRRCLEKEPRRRLRDIGDIAITLEETTIELQRPTLQTKVVEAGRARLTGNLKRLLPWFVTGAAVIILVLIGIIIGLKLGGPSEKKPGKSTSTPIVKPINAIVVLPFENLSGDPEQEYFVDGMTDALSAELGKIKALRVISRTSAMHYKDTDKMIPEIAKELSVDAVIEGSVLKVGNDVRVTAQLVDGRTDAHLWSDNYTGTLTNILALQSEVTLAIAREIEAALTPEEERRIKHTKAVNAEAYEAFLKGKFFLNKRTEDTSKTAIHYFEQAIEQNPSYALAHAGLAECYIVLGFYAYLEPNEAFPKAKMEAQKALSIDNTLAEAHTSLAYISTVYEWNWESAESGFKRAIELNPNYATAHQWYSIFLNSMRRHDEAIVEIKQAQKLDPVSNMINTDVGEVYLSMHQYDQAIDAFQNVLAMDKGFWRAHWSLARAYLQKQKFEKALEEIQKSRDLLTGWQPWIECSKGIIYARMGKREDAQQVLNNLLKRSKREYVPPIIFADLHFALDENDKGFDWLKEAHKGRDPILTFLKVRPVYDSVRSDPRFSEVLKQMRFPETSDSRIAAEPSEVTKAPIEKIAVLPFTSISSEASEEWFVDGMTVTLTTQLGRIKALTVISSRSAMELKGTSKPVREIARELGVDGLIEGTVIRVGNKVQITTQLIDGRRDEQIWADIFQGTFDDILSLQSEVTLAIAKKIEVALTPEEKLRFAYTKPINPDAYEAFLKGQFFLWKFTETGFRSAFNYFEQAIEIDPNYAEVHAWLSRAYWVPSIWGYSRPTESFPKARSAANKAMVLDETLATAHGSVGWIAMGYDWQWQKAKESFERAIKLNRNDPDAYEGLSWYFVVAGRLDEAMEMMQTAVKLDPLSCLYNNGLAWRYHNSGQVERAIEQRKKTLELNPGFVDAMDGLAEDYIRMSKYPEAIASIEKAMSLASRTPRLATTLARAYALSGEKDKAETLVKELHKRAANEYIVPTFFAELYANLGDADEAFRWLEKGYKERNWIMLFLRISTRFDPLRSDPRFDGFIRRMKYPE
jgi:TolB-like protein/Flp pilus assembly protein TadD